ncbi:MAG: hypothetical protein QOF18_1234 [Frankiaceae bacterium]|nr:hypothetical protein [Frankiaceae bacterium]
MYSVVNIAAVVRDLSRHPHGGALARDLTHVLSLDLAALAEMDAGADPNGAARLAEQAIARVTAEPLALELLAAARQVSDVAGLAAWTSSIDLLERAPLGGAGELHRWLRDELLEIGWQHGDGISLARFPVALDIVCAGMLDTYVGGPVVDTSWRRWVASHEPATVTEPALLQLVARLRATCRGSLVAAGTAMRAARAAGWSWAAAMHDACWAVELTGRGRETAVAQLEALAAVIDIAGPTPLDPEIVSAVTAAVHATAVADVLTGETLTDLRRPLLAHLG